MASCVIESEKEFALVGANLEQQMSRHVEFGLSDENLVIIEGHSYAGHLLLV